MTAIPAPLALGIIALAISLVAFIRARSKEACPKCGSRNKHVQSLAPGKFRYTCIDPSCGCSWEK